MCGMTLRFNPYPASILHSQLSCALRCIAADSLACDAAIESVHTIIVMATTAGAAKFAHGVSFAGPDFDLTFANDYSSRGMKTATESKIPKGEILACTKVSGGFAVDISFSGKHHAFLPDLHPRRLDGHFAYTECSAML